ncbi:SDR family NAD(P)-dependent oxidoreductase [Oscillibacter sp.]|uniref:SDR family NAD(P)-dependent oxidoreductase n=1 Tax=Oscillibacter sp. TaxID=1945593 RepID=UPI00261B3CA3|nr:SDR family NAD(P)-dependent oxidoreductase [Oscillibacter sp.]MDD3347438.1 SDR family NAD(P)-dependent oxidoreductase [Oscillibacter sp.]
MQVDLKDKVVLVTGAGGAIGGAMAKAFARNGAKVAVAGRTLATLQATVDEITAAGGAAAAVIADVGNKESARAMIEETVGLFGALDVLVNNAGINGGPEERKPIHQYSDELWEKIINVDLNGVYYCSKPAILQMEKQGHGGSIINIGSIVGLAPLRLQCAFTAAKAGVFNLTKAMALELAPLNIRVNGIAPGSIMFEGTKKLFYADAQKAEAMMSHIPMHRPGEPEDIAGMACFLASDDSAYMTGTVNVVDGGWICGYTRDF